jgi:hypothetical protein
MKKSEKKNMLIICLVTILCAMGCKGIIEIDPPKDSITTRQVFENKEDATAALLGIYSYMANGGAGSFNNPTNASLTILCGMSADELLPYISSDIRLVHFYTNALLADNSYGHYFWIYFYSYMYQTNAVLEGLTASTGISQNVKEELLAEAKFLRAFNNFYLVNLFGDIPLITNTDYKSNKLASRTSMNGVYRAIINDLTDAKKMLPADYIAGGGERVRANKWAAGALLARTYLYTGDFLNSEAEATAVINHTALYSLVDLDKVFLTNSLEAILQWHNNSGSNNENYNATPEGFLLIPNSSATQPNYLVTEQLLNSFEAGDRRSVSWLQHYTYDGIDYAYPYKYKTGSAEAKPNGQITEYYTVLRLAELYLIRAEARAQQGNLTGAIADVNRIRNRAGLDDVAALSKDQVLSAIMQERKIELFSELGHRWLDLKRTGKVGQAFSQLPYKSAYKPYQNLYPIPGVELDVAPNLIQNTGY